MNDYVLSCCSAADLSKEHFNTRNIRYICYRYELDGVCYSDDPGESMDREIFYQKMAQGASTKTSAINAAEYEDYFESILKEGKDILHLTLSSGLTSTMNGACIARTNLKEKYPERKIILVDSLCASVGYGLLMDKLADKRDEGYSLEQLAQFATENRTKCHCTFFSSDLTFFIRGGRISKAAGAFGMALGICPMIVVDKTGKLTIVEKIRTKKKAIRALLEMLLENTGGGADYSEKCYVCHTGCSEDAQTLASLIKLNFPKMSTPVPISYIGTTIGSHTGPGLVGIGYWGKEREI